MPQDAFTLRYLSNELNNIFAGGKVNKIVQPSNDEVVLTLYTGRRTEKLLLNVNPSSPRIGIISEEKESPLTAPNFCMLLRKHLLSATLESIELIGFDRIIKIDFMASAEFFDATKKTVYVELMGRYSNVILTENGKILGGNRGINMFDNGVRPLIVGKDYVFPPVGDKKLPNDINLIEVFSNSGFSDLAQTICKNVQGLALSTAKEIEKSFLDSVSCGKLSLTANCLYEHINNYIYNTKAKPCVVFCDKKVQDVCVYPYDGCKDVRLFDFLYLAEDFYFTEKENAKKFSNKCERLCAITNSQIKKTKKKLVAISAKEKEASTAEENRIKGELLLSNIYQISQGQSECVLDNYYDGSKVKITLDERLSVSKNAENYYKKYNKQKRTLVALKPQREQAESELAYYLSVLDQITLCETFEELVLVQKELESVGLMPMQQSHKKKKTEETFYRVYCVSGFIVKAGRNNAENDKLTFTSASNDVWLHAKDYHSSHVIIETLGKPVPDNVLTISAQICAYYSKGRESGKAEVVYTERKNVKKPPKSKLGFCTYEKFKSIVVEPEKHAEFLKT